MPIKNCFFALLYNYQLSTVNTSISGSVPQDQLINILLLARRLLSVASGAVCDLVGEADDECVSDRLFRVRAVFDEELHDDRMFFPPLNNAACGNYVHAISIR